MAGKNPKEGGSGSKEQWFVKGFIKYCGAFASDKPSFIEYPLEGTMEQVKNEARAIIDEHLARHEVHHVPPCNPVLIFTREK